MFHWQHFHWCHTIRHIRPLPWCRWGIIVTEAPVKMEWVSWPKILLTNYQLISHKTPEQQSPWCNNKWKSTQINGYMLQLILKPSSCQYIRIDREAINTELRFIVSEKFEISNISRNLSFKLEFFILQYITVKFFQTSCYYLFFYWIALFARGHLYQIVLYHIHELKSC